MENDFRRSTFDIVHKLRTRPMEIGPRVDEAVRMSKQSYTDEVLLRLGLDEEMLDRFKAVDALTWSLLFHYHHILYQREKVILSKLNLSYSSFS